jgi:hypothetical protein
LFAPVGNQIKTNLVQLPLVGWASRGTVPCQESGKGKFEVKKLKAWAKRLFQFGVDLLVGCDEPPTTN